MTGAARVPSDAGSRPHASVGEAARLPRHPVDRASHARAGVTGDARLLHDAYVAKVNSAVAAGQEELVAELVAWYGRESRTGLPR